VEAAAIVLLCMLAAQHVFELCLQGCFLGYDLCNLTFFLAGETICESYDTEYSTDKIEMHTGAVNAGQRVVLVGSAAYVIHGFVQQIQTSPCDAHAA
jgi:hypothetical protein